MLSYLARGRFGSHIPIDVLWQSILGVTDQYLRYRLREDMYNECCSRIYEDLQFHMEAISGRSKYNVSDGETGVVIPGSESGTIQSNMEFRFFMYHHWSLFEAMYHSPYMATKLQLWYSNGINKLQELLAKIGLPLSQSQQYYNYIPSEQK